MEMILLIGIQATGKSTFCRSRLFDRHVRINRDMLGTRNRERLLVTACLEGKTRFVVDNTNLTKTERARFIQPARVAGFRVVGYFFASRVGEAMARNALRPDGQRVPDLAIPGASKRMQLPTRTEGFDELYFVRLAEPEGFLVEEWRDEV
jgi:predicted kinase